MFRPFKRPRIQKNKPTWSAKVNPGFRCIPCLELLEDRTMPSVSVVSKAPAYDIPASGDSFGSSMSSDGRFTAFASNATDLVPGQNDSNADYDVFLYDRVLGTRTLVSHSSSSSTTTANGGISDSFISADGNFVVFDSNATDLVPNQSGSNTIFSVFLYERATGKNTLVSHTSASPSTSGNKSSFIGPISSDGRFVAFSSNATNLVNGQTDSNNDQDVFLFDRLFGGITLVSHASGSTFTTGNGPSDEPIISADGSFIAYHSLSTNLVAGQNDMANSDDIFLYDRSTGVTTLVSHKNGAVNTTGNGFSLLEAMSGDGSIFAFISAATDLVPGFMDGNGASASDLFVFNRTLGTTTLVSHIPGSS